MRTNKIKTNVTVLNKVDRKLYKIINVDGSNETIRGTAKLIKDDESLDDAVTTVITANNAIAYRLIDDPNIPEVPTGYTVDDGMLLKDGVPATEQGSLVINKIIMAVAGRLILEVKPREPRDGYIDLMTYTIETDKFKKLIRTSIPEVNVLAVSEDQNKLYMAYSRTYSEEKKLEDGTTKTDTIFDAAAIMSYDVKQDAVTDSVMLGTPIKAVNSVINSESTVFAIESDTVVDSNDVVSEDEEVTLNYIKADGNYLDAFNCVSIDNAPTVISMGYNNTLIKTTSNKWYIDETSYNIPEKIVSALAGYNVIVDVTTKDHVTRVSLVNTLSMEVKTLVVAETRDRGNVISVE